MTKSGEKLYGNWHKLDASKREGLFSSRRFWIGFGVMVVVIAAGVWWIS